MNIDSMLSALIKREGGFSHLPADKGGATKFGITQGTLAFWRHSLATIEDVKNLTEIEAKAIYKDLYYNRPKIAGLPDPLDDFMFDFAVNSGPQLAIMALQETLKIKADGVIGPVTLAAAYAADLHTLINGMVRWRVMMIARIVKRDLSQVAFLAGWLSRCFEFVV